MLIALGVLLGALAALNRGYGGSWLYPPAAFCAIWTALVTGLLLARHTFDPVSIDVLLLFGAGALCFSVGGFLADRLRVVRQLGGAETTTARPGMTPAQRRMLIVGAAVLLGLLPAYWRGILSMSAASMTPDLWQAIRSQTVAASEGDVGLGALGLVVPFATFLTLIAVYLGPRTTTERFVVGIIVVAGLGIQVVTTARLGAFVTLFALAAVFWLRDGRIKVLYLALFLVCFSLVFAFAAIVLEKGATRDADVLDNARMLADSFRVYLLGGLVAFDKVVRESAPGSPPYYTLRFFYAVARSLGWNAEVPSIVLPFSAVPDLTNVYTIYYPYYTDFGTAGLCLLSGVLGAVLTALYRMARTGKPAPAVLYSLAFAFLLLSSSLEGFAVNLSYWIRASVFVSVFFRLPDWLSRLKPSR